MERRDLVTTGPASSTGSPMTFMMRPSVSSPTGTVIGAPVSVTAWPRTRPSVVSMAMQRTVFSPRCCATSSTSRLPPFVGLQRVQDLRQVAVELHVDDGADDLRTCRPCPGQQLRRRRLDRSAPRRRCRLGGAALLAALAFGAAAFAGTALLATGAFLAAGAALGVAAFAIFLASCLRALPRPK